jgi:hypothetical protein
MSHEFDEAAEPTARRTERRPLEMRHARRPLVPRLIARLYASADQPLRAKLLACLVRPLSSLGLVAVAAGAFARFLLAGDAGRATIAIEDASRYSSDQIFELARFVEQVSPGAVRQFAGLITASPLAVAAFSASAVVLLLKQLPSRESGLRL